MYPIDLDSCRPVDVIQRAMLVYPASLAQTLEDRAGVHKRFGSDLSASAIKAKHAVENSQGDVLTKDPEAFSEAFEAAADIQFINGDVRSRILAR